MFMDLTEANSNPKYIMKMEEWERSHPDAKYRFKLDIPSFNKEHNTQLERKKGITCFHCSKAGHVSSECHTRLASEKQPTPSLFHGVTAAPTNMTTRADRKPVMCFTCHQQGHKSPQCPKKVTTTIKQIQIPINHVKPFKDNEVIGMVDGHMLPITVDSGAEISMVPEKCVKESQFTGETCTVNAFNSSKFTGRKCNVQVTVGDRVFTRTAMTQPGEVISWTAIVSFRIADDRDREHLVNQLKRKDRRTCTTCLQGWNKEPQLW